MTADRPDRFVRHGGGGYAVYGPPGGGYADEDRPYGYVARHRRNPRAWEWYRQDGSFTFREFSTRRAAALALIQNRTGRVPGELLPVPAPLPPLCGRVPVEELRAGDLVRFPVDIRAHPEKGPTVTRWGIAVVLTEVMHGKEGWTAFTYRRPGGRRRGEWMLVSSYRDVGVAREAPPGDVILVALDEQVRHTVEMHDISLDPGRDTVRFGVGGPGSPCRGGVGLRGSEYLVELSHGPAQGAPAGSARCATPGEIGPALIMLFREHAERSGSVCLNRKGHSWSEATATEQRSGGFPTPRPGKSSRRSSGASTKG